MLRMRAVAQYYCTGLSRAVLAAARLWLHILDHTHEG